MNLRNLLVGAVALSAIATAASAADQTATANASATIVTPAAIASTQDLAFGTIAKPTTGTNTVTVAPAAGAQTPTFGQSDTGNAYIATAGQGRAAIFNLSGTGGAAYTFVTGTNGSKLTFGAADSHLSPQVVLPSAGSLSGAGQATVPVGGTITITNSTPTTTYNGTLTLVANFN